jgi:hypothetical protein
MKTKNYNLFGYMKSNRSINNGLVERLVKSINEIGYIESRPVIVNEDMIIIDGQHRFEACKRLELPIVYEVSNVDMAKAMVALNMNQQIWRLEDYVNSYAAQGRECYIYISNFENKYKLGISNSLLLCTDKLLRKGAEIRNGKDFLIAKDAHQVAEFVLNCKDYFSFYKNGTFVYSIKLLFKYASPSDVKKVYSKIQSLRQQAKASDYLSCYENIINKNKKTNEAKVILNK